MNTLTIARGASKASIIMIRRQVGLTSSSMRFMSDLGDTWNKKVKVEEDRFIAKKDMAYLNSTRKEIEAVKRKVEQDAEDLFFQTKVLPLVNEIKGVLGEEDCGKVSKESLKKLAYWKMGGN
mmetsp:Transcript_9144/g.14186  ORF Transcript_9144/g.14186 Transcript_9144/m.14186 type:complete len:122 (-) Transcript_9144:58-423(-)